MTFIFIEVFEEESLRAKNIVKKLLINLRENLGHDIALGQHLLQKSQRFCGIKNFKNFNHFFSHCY